MTTIPVDERMRTILSRLLLREGVARRAPAPQPASAQLRFLELRRLEGMVRQRARVFGQEFRVYRRGWRGRMELLFKKVLQKVLRWHAWPQIEFNGTLAESVAECIQQFDRLAADIASLRRDLRAATRDMQPAAEPSAARLSINYRHFEDRFRGSRQLVQERQRSYVRYFEGCAPVLDIGCGRGEFLDLLRDAGIVSYGIDADADMVDECRRQGLQALHEDAFTHLPGLPEGALGGIYISHVVEHLPPEEILRLLRLASDRLAWHGWIIMETPNPICESAMRNFYLDPTHVRPVHPELLRFLAEEAGLSFVQFIFTSELPGHAPATREVERRLEENDVTGYRDYAALFRRT